MAEHTLDPQAWFWATVAKAGQGVPPPEEAEMLNDWELLHWVMPELWGWQTIPYNPEALTSKAWLEELRQGRYRGRPRTGDRPYGDGRATGPSSRTGCVRHPHRQRGVELERLGGMDITPRTLALLLAALLFAVCAFWSPPAPPRVSLLSLGLFMVSVALLLP